jgi:hypothetical protein
MKVSEAYPSNYLKADDLQGRDVVVTIESVDLEKIGQGADQDTKLVLGFRGKEKKLVCNKTNAGTISGLYGDETDDWIGKQVILTSREVEFQGKMTLAIRVSLKKPATAAPKPAPTTPEPSDNDGDQIPF